MARQKARPTTARTIVYAHFLKARPGRFAHHSARCLRRQGGGYGQDPLVALGTTATLGGHHFLNARLVSGNGKTEAGEPAGTMPLLYTIDAKGALTLKLMDEKAAKALIKAGKIKGDAGEGDNGDAIITADSKALDAFGYAVPWPQLAALFVKPLFVLHKVS